MNSRIIDDIGVINYKTSVRAKHLRICVKESGVTVSVPRGMPLKTVDEFVFSKILWIKKAVEKINSAKPSKTVFTSGYSTKFHTLRMIPDKRNNLRMKLCEQNIDVFYPENADIEDKNIQLGIYKIIEHVLKIEANTYLPERMCLLANNNKFNFKSLTIKNIKSFWGKCTADNSIILNLHLMRLPDHLIDYVILHELCHTIHKNHQKGFWNLLNNITAGKAKIFAKEMKKQVAIRLL